jgi:hypothetical protein
MFFGPLIIWRRFSVSKEQSKLCSISIIFTRISKRLTTSRDASDLAKANYDRLDHYIVNEGITRKEIKNIRTRYVTSHQRWLGIQEEVCRIEEVLGIEARWTSNSPEYQDALTVLNQRKYRRALDKLERLLVQRMFELTKLGMSGVGK